MRQPLALQEPAELREQAFAEWLVLVENLEQKIIAVLPFRRFRQLKACSFTKQSSNRFFDISAWSRL